MDYFRKITKWLNTNFGPIHSGWVFFGPACNCWEIELTLYFVRTACARIKKNTHINCMIYQLEINFKLHILTLAEAGVPLLYFQTDIFASLHLNKLLLQSCSHYLRSLDFKFNSLDFWFSMSIMYMYDWTLTLISSLYVVLRAWVQHFIPSQNSSIMISRIQDGFYYLEFTAWQMTNALKSHWAG